MSAPSDIPASNVRDLRHKATVILSTLAVVVLVGYLRYTQRRNEQSDAATIRANRDRYITEVRDIRRIQREVLRRKR